MSVPAFPQVPPDDPKSIELVRTIIQKTVENKIYWHKQPDGFAAIQKLTTSLQLSFRFTRRAINFMSGYMPNDAWETFEVKSSAEGSVLTVKNDEAFNILSVLAGSGTVLLKTTRELFQLVRERAEGTLDRTIKSLKEL
jgi:hypothetical protein